MLNTLKKIFRGLLDRILDSFALFLGEATPPQSEIDRFLANLEAQVTVLQAQIAAMLVQKESLEEMRRTALALSESAEHEAETALLRGDDAAARSALHRRLPHTRRADALRDELTQQERVIQDLQKALNLLQATLAEAHSQRDLLLAQEHRLQAEQLALQALHPYGTARDLHTALDQANRALARRQDRLQAAQEIEQTSLARQRAELETEDAVNADLQALRRRLEER
jgi:phage shock protein A